MLVLSIACDASAAFIKLVQIDNDTIEARIQLEEDVFIKGVDVGILIEGGLATSLTSSGTPFDGMFQALRSFITDEGRVVFFSGQTPIEIGPFKAGSEFSMGTFDWQFEPGSTSAAFSIDPETLYRILDGDSKPIQTESFGPPLRVDRIVDEPKIIVLLGVASLVYLLANRIDRRHAVRDA